MNEIVTRIDDEDRQQIKKIYGRNIYIFSVINVVSLTIFGCINYYNNPQHLSLAEQIGALIFLALMAVIGTYFLNGKYLRLIKATEKRSIRGIVTTNTFHGQNALFTIQLSNGEIREASVFLDTGATPNTFNKFEHGDKVTVDEAIIDKNGATYYEIIRVDRV